MSFEYSIKSLGSLQYYNILNQVFYVYQLKVDILLLMDLLHIDIFYQYLIGGLLNLIMNFFFLIKSLQLLIFCMIGLEYGTNVFYFNIKLIILYLILHSAILFCILFQHYEYDVILTKVCKLFSSLLLSAILLISSVYVLCRSLLNRCCNFDMIHCSVSNFYYH